MRYPTERPEDDDQIRKSDPPSTKGAAEFNRYGV